MSPLRGLKKLYRNGDTDMTDKISLKWTPRDEMTDASIEVFIGNTDLPQFEIQVVSKKQFLIHRLFYKDGELDALQTIGSAANSDLAVAAAADCWHKINLPN